MISSENGWHPVHELQRMGQHKDMWKSECMMAKGKEKGKRERERAIKK